VDLMALDIPMEYAYSRRIYCLNSYYFNSKNSTNYLISSVQLAIHYFYWQSRVAQGAALALRTSTVRVCGFVDNFTGYAAEVDPQNHIADAPAHTLACLLFLIKVAKDSNPPGIKCIPRTKNPSFTPW
jgi:hypothetical protein